MRESLEDKVQYREDVEQKAAFRRNLLIVLVIAAIAVGGFIFKDNILQFVNTSIRPVLGI